MALPLVHRLRRSREFSRVYQHGTRHKSRHLTLRALPSRGAIRLPAAPALSSAPAAPSQSIQLPAVPERPTQIGISISQKVSKRAVVRNRIKRQIRAALCHLLPRLMNNWQVVVVVHPDAIECDYWEFLRELEQLLTRAEVLHGH